MTQKDISSAIIRAGLGNKVICFHSSLKSFGTVEGGAIAVVQAFLNEGCTLVVPTFYYDSIVPAPEDKRYKQNGCNYDNDFQVKLEDIEPYYDAENMIVKDMGAIPAEVLKIKERVRGNHPINSLSAIGPKAKDIIDLQTPMEVYAPYKAIYDNYDTFLLLAGVGLTRATPIHFAEQLAGRTLFRRWAKVLGNEIVETQVGSCSEGFNKFDPYVKGIEKSVEPWEHSWRIYPFREFIDRVVTAIKNDPSLTHCEDNDCIRCNDSVKGGPIFI